MGERKVLNKYIPPSFDPSIIPRRKQAANAQQEVRLMAPFSMRCKTCGEYIYKSKKFNARKETVKGETYYDIKIFRFYIKCPQCSSEITFKTDPQNTDYKAEHGATRNFEPWRTSKSPDPDRDPLAHLLEDEEKDEAQDAMAALEQRTLESQREMEILDALQDIRTRNARSARADADLVLQRVRSQVDAKEEEDRRRAQREDEQLIRKYFGRDATVSDAEASGGMGGSLGLASHAVNGSPSPRGRSAESFSVPSAAPSAKRARPEEETEDVVEPDVTSLLSESCARKLQLQRRRQEQRQPGSL